MSRPTQQTSPDWTSSLVRLDAFQHKMAARSPVRAHIFVMSLLFSVALAVGYFLLPGDAERIAMLERDGKTGLAKGILESKFAGGDRRQRTLFLLQGLYEQSGDIPKARQTLELLAEQRPRDPNVQQRLGLFYKLTHAEPAYIKTLTAQIELRYSESACRELIGLLRRSGAFADEQATLIKCRHKGYRRPDDMIRLASLLAVDGDIKEASLLLRAVDDLRRLKSDRERLQLFDLLLENEQPGEAQRRAVRWVKGGKDDNFALTLISALVTNNRHDLAIELARETSVPGDSVFLSVAEIMVDREQTTAAQAILRGWLDKAATLEPAVATRFVAAAIACADPDLALAGAQKAGLGKLPSDSVEKLARTLESAGRRADSATLRATVRKLTGLDVPEAVEPPQTGRRTSQAMKFSGLDPWRSALWKRLRDENKIVTNTGASGNAAVRNTRTAKDLQALKRARKAKTYRRLIQPKGKPGPQVTPAFEFFPKL